MISDLKIFPILLLETAELWFIVGFTLCRYFLVWAMLWFNRMWSGREDSLEKRKITKNLKMPSLQYLTVQIVLTEGKTSLITVYPKMLKIMTKQAWNFRKWNQPPFYLIICKHSKNTKLYYHTRCCVGLRHSRNKKQNSTLAIYSQTIPLKS